MPCLFMTVLEFMLRFLFDLCISYLPFDKKIVSYQEGVRIYGTTGYPDDW